MLINRDFVGYMATEVIKKSPKPNWLKLKTRLPSP